MSGLSDYFAVREVSVTQYPQKGSALRASCYYGGGSLPLFLSHKFPMSVLSELYAVREVSVTQYAEKGKRTLETWTSVRKVVYPSQACFLGPAREPEDIVQFTLKTNRSKEEDFSLRRVFPAIVPQLKPNGANVH
jgi:hypothetical protein